MGLSIIDLMKKHTSKDLFLKISHIHLRDLKGAAEVYSQVDLSPDEYDELLNAVREIDREKKEERYFGARNT